MRTENKKPFSWIRNGNTPRFRQGQKSVLINGRDLRITNLCVGEIDKNKKYLPTFDTYSEYESYQAGISITTGTELDIPRPRLITTIKYLNLEFNANIKLRRRTGSECVSLISLLRRQVEYSHLAKRMQGVFVFDAEFKNVSAFILSRRPTFIRSSIVQWTSCVAAIVSLEQSLPPTIAFTTDLEDKVSNKAQQASVKM